MRRAGYRDVLTLIGRRGLRVVTAAKTEVEGQAVIDPRELVAPALELVAGAGSPLPPLSSFLRDQL